MQPSASVTQLRDELAQLDEKCAYLRSQIASVEAQRREQRREIGQLEAQLTTQKKSSGGRGSAAKRRRPGSLEKAASLSTGEAEAATSSPAAQSSSAVPVHPQRKSSAGTTGTAEPSEPTEPAEPAVQPAKPASAPDIGDPTETELLQAVAMDDSESALYTPTASVYAAPYREKTVQKELEEAAWRESQLRFVISRDVRRPSGFDGFAMCRETRGKRGHVSVELTQLSYPQDKTLLGQQLLAAVRCRASATAPQRAAHRPHVTRAPPCCPPPVRPAPSRAAVHCVPARCCRSSWRGCTPSRARSTSSSTRAARSCARPGRPSASLASRAATRCRARSRESEGRPEQRPRATAVLGAL